MKTKKLKEYYKNVNARLDDWLEVDSVVKAMADDILDSMNPDVDHDGINDHEGALVIYHDSCLRALHCSLLHHP